MLVQHYAATPYVNAYIRCRKRENAALAAYYATPDGPARQAFVRDIVRWWQAGQRLQRWVTQHPPTSLAATQ